MTLYQFFDWRWVSFRSFTGWMVSTANVCAALAAAVALRFLVRLSRSAALEDSGCSGVGAPQGQRLILPSSEAALFFGPACPHSPNSRPRDVLSMQVERAIKCLDFAATLYLIHLAAVCSYSGFPRGFEW